MSALAVRRRTLILLIAGCAAIALVPESNAIAHRGEAAADGPQYGIAFADFGPVDTDIFIADADGGHARALLCTPAFEANASFSADGQWIIFSSNRSGSWDIWRAHPDGSRLERLIDDPAFDDQAALSPDGRSLAFVSSRTGQADIWILDLA